ncbi:MAG TPA: diaminopropionate ammonia-lyase [Phenylobacterium sp.]
MSRSAFSFLVNPHRTPAEPFPFHAEFPPRGGAAALAALSACPRYAPTPLISLPGAAQRSGVAEVRYKDESGRFGLGSFKALGGAYAVARLLAEEVSRALGRPVGLAELARGEHAELTRRLTVVCASDGNHGRAVAAGAKVFRTRAVIYFHEGVSDGREAAVRTLGAEVVRTKGVYDESVRLAGEAAVREGWLVVSDTAAEPAGETAGVPLMVMEGYRVLVMEALDQLRAAGRPPPTHLFLQSGVGGLAAAVTAHLWSEFGADRPKVVVVEPTRADCLMRSAAAGQPVAVEGDLQTLMAGLACGEVSRVAWPVLKAGAEAFMAIDDLAAVDAMQALAEGGLGAEPIVAGESGVAGLAGLLALPLGGAEWLSLGLGPSSRVLVVGTEGATDPDIYHALVGRRVAAVG